MVKTAPNQTTSNQNDRDRRFKLACRAVLWLAAIGLIGWLLNQTLAPLGTAVYSTNLLSPSTVIKFTSPSSVLNFVDADGVRRARLADENIRFEFKPPVSFERAELSIRFRNKTRSNV